MRVDPATEQRLEKVARLVADAIANPILLLPDEAATRRVVESATRFVLQEPAKQTLRRAVTSRVVPAVEKTQLSQTGREPRRQVSAEPMMPQAFSLPPILGGDQREEPITNQIIEPRTGDRAAADVVGDAIPQRVEPMESSRFARRKCKVR